MKLTAVEWLLQQFANKGYVELQDELQAKDMEKRQIMTAVYDSMGTNTDPNMGRAEEYYNETYGKK